MGKSSSKAVMENMWEIPVWSKLYLQRLQRQLGEGRRKMILPCGPDEARQQLGERSERGGWGWGEGERNRTGQGGRRGEAVVVELVHIEYGGRQESG